MIFIGVVLAVVGWFTAIGSGMMSTLEYSNGQRAFSMLLSLVLIGCACYVFASL